MELERYLYMERLRYQAAVLWERELPLLTRAGLVDGVKILEAGCGPGFITEKLARVCPHSALTVVEKDAGFLEAALQYIKAAQIRGVEAIAADVGNTGLASESFDFIYARFLLQHLPDPGMAIAELYRLLKPGGKLVILDIDEGFPPVIEPWLPEMEALLGNNGKKNMAVSGRDVQIGRKLWRLLKGHGFHALGLEALLIHSDAVDLEKLFLEFDLFALEKRVAHGMMPASELAQLQQLRQRFLSQPEAYFSYLLFMGYGEK